MTERAVVGLKRGRGRWFARFMNKHDHDLGRFNNI